MNNSGLQLWGFRKTSNQLPKRDQPVRPLKEQPLEATDMKELQHPIGLIEYEFIRWMGQLVPKWSGQGWLVSWSVCSSGSHQVFVLFLSTSHHKIINVSQTPLKSKVAIKTIYSTFLCKTSKCKKSMETYDKSDAAQ